MLIVAVELFCKLVQDKMSCGKYRSPDIEEQDPASLVGTFKRYKWHVNLYIDLCVDIKGLRNIEFNFLVY